MASEEFCENIPPEVQDTKDVEYSSIHLGGENEHLSRACKFSTPSSCRRVKMKAWLSGVPSALTPIIKNLDIANKCTTPEPFKHGNNLCPPASSSSCGKTSQHPHTVSSLGGTKTADSWLLDESLPDVTMEDTYDCTADISALPSSNPITAELVHSSNIQSHLGASISLKTVPEIPCLQNVTRDLEQSDVSDLTPEHQTTDQVSKNSPETSDCPCDAQGALGKTDSIVVSTQPQNDQRNVSETCPSDSHQVTMDMPCSPKIPESKADNSGVRFPEPSADPNRTTSMHVPENMDAPLRWLDSRFFPEITLLDVTPDNDPVAVEMQISCDTDPNGQNSTTLNGSASSVTTISSAAEKRSGNCPDDNTPKASMHLTQDISMSSVLDEASDQTTGKVQTSTESTHARQPANITRDLSSSNNISVQCVDMTGITSPKNLTTELQREPSVTSNTVEVADDQLLASTVVKATDGVSQPSPKPPRSLNSTFERNSSRTSCGSSASGEMGGGPFCIPNKTFDTTPGTKQNGTITLSSSSDWPQKTFEMVSTPSAGNATFTPKAGQGSSEIQPLKCLKPDMTAFEEDPEVQMADKPQVVSKVLNKTEDHSAPELPTTDGLPELFSDHSIHGVNTEAANVLNLDDTFSLSHPMITSTPMVDCKTLPVVDWEQGRATVAQRKLYGDGGKELNGPAPPDAPSNIVSDRKTFMSRPATGCLVPPSKPASQLLMYKRASLLPSRLAPPTSGLPMTRQRSQAVMRQKPQPRTTAAAAAAAPLETTGKPASYNLRSSLQGPKSSPWPVQRPQLTGIQRATTCLRPPTCGPKATKAPTSTKHPLTGGETLPVPKKKKIDIPVSPGASEQLVSAASGPAKSLRQPTTGLRALPARRGDGSVGSSISAEKTSSFSAKPAKQPAATRKSALPKSSASGCSKCGLLQQQLEMKSDEIKRLQQELLKYRGPVKEES